jgi:uncharacterized protein
MGKLKDTIRTKIVAPTLPCTEGMRNLGDLYAKGQGGAQDYAQARGWYEKAAKAGNARAMCNLGVLYANGQGIAQDYDKAREWYQKAADAGNPDAMKNLGDLYLNDQGVAKDYLKEAFDLFLRDAILGDSFAMMKVGRLYLRKGTPRDNEAGFRWLNLAFHAPKPNLEAGAFIADCYLSGMGTAQDVQKAEEIVFPLANQGVVPAMTLAGKILQYRADIKRSEAVGNSSPQLRKKLEAEASEMDRQARQSLERAAKDDWNASARLGQFYEQGLGGIEKNEAEAEKRYKEGIAHGNALSMFFYGRLLENKPDRRSEAERLISQAATAGIPSAKRWCKQNGVEFTEATPH